MAREIKRFDIYFKDPNTTYRAGDVVSGSVQLELNQELKLRGIRLNLHGVSRTGWDEKRAYTKGSASKLSHKHMEVFLDESMIVVRPNNSTLAPGRYDWPFNIRLPPYLPASFEGHWGRVQYWAKGVIDRPWKGDVELVKNFTVLGALDLNTDNEAKTQIENAAEIMAGTICCRSGPISGHLMLERQGFCPGENLEFKSEIKNNSKKKLNVRAVLSQVATFRADKQVKKYNTVLRGRDKGEIRPGETAEWADELKNIPPVPPSRLGAGCKNIDVKYVLTLIVIPSGPGPTLEVPVEVIIGTIPLRKIHEASDPRLTVKAAVRRASFDVSSGDLRVASASANKDA
eukprot:GHVU01086052.1.p1 GENE.GHVU01086052.1~~GHVU01086052.1.p1  ORF type:complete len:344 (+),score=42.08 GHVU01086052.1:303-1334(+)